MLKYYSGYDLEPAIYFIIKDTVVYIGCSNKMAVIDWGKHVTLDGDFYTRLRDYDDYIFAEDYEVHFLSFSCNDIEKYLDYPYIKRELEYIEDILHGLFNRSSFINYKLLSDTKSSAPDVAHNENKSKELAEIIYKEFIEKFKVIIKIPA